MKMAKVTKATFNRNLKKAEAGDKLAQYKVSSYYRYGSADGVSRDYAKAFEWAMKASNAGLREAMTMAGDALLWGKGVKSDERAGLKLLQKASELGCDEASFAIRSYNTTKSA